MPEKKKQENLKQELLIKRFLMSTATYVIWICLVFSFYFQGLLRLSIFGACLFAVIVVLINIGLYVVFRVGLNQSFKDPSLTLFQIIIALSIGMIATYYTNENRGIMLPLYLVILMFGVFKFRVRQFIFPALFSIIGYAFVIMLLLHFHPDKVDFKLEVLHWLVLATMLPWFALMGGYISKLRDRIFLTNRKLGESLIRYRELYEDMIDIVVLVDKRGNLLLANPLFYKIIGIPNSEIIGISCKEYVHYEDWPIVRNYMVSRFLKEKDIRDFQFRIVSTNKEIFYVECNARCVKKNDEIVGFQMVMRDITKRKMLKKDLSESHKKYQNAKAITILGLAKLAEYRDKNTGRHLERMREYVRLLATALAKKGKYAEYITEEYIEDIYLSAVLHDIGKVGIPDSILLKPGELTAEEFETVKQHSILGGDALRAAEERIDGYSFLTLGKEISYCHHERWDGTGYPAGLKGAKIPLSARLVAFADAYDALTSKRAYKDAFSHEKSKGILVRERGKHFDPDVVDAFLSYEIKFKAICKRLHKHDNVLPIQEYRKKNI